LRVLVIERWTFLLILLGIMAGLGFWFQRIAQRQTVFVPQKKEVAIIIDDFGGRAAGIKEMMALPYTLTFAVLPFEEFSRQQARKAMNKGFEIIVHMPFEAFGADPRWYGKKYISANSTPLAIKQLIGESFQILPMATGLSNHMGSKATASSKVMEEVFKELQRKNCFYLDSGTALTASPVSKIATELSLPFAKRDIFLDNQNSASHMRHQLKKLMELARTRGMSIGIGHVGQTGIALAGVLHEELPKYEKEGFHFIPLSELVYTRVPAKPHKNKNIVIGIDPGHGGIDSGTKWEKMLEKDLNLKFSQKLAEGLAERGYRVVLTRNEDQLLTPLAHYTYKNRPYKMDDFRCRIQKLEGVNASVIVCIHTNWSQLSYHRGPIAYYSTHSPVSQKIAQHIQEQLNLVQPYRKLPKPSGYCFLVQSEVPSVLIELGFFSNREDRKLLQDDNYLEQLKLAIINGLAKTL
jgi:polysaccharide deacetylase 2 family uncharacterized protein YibQ